MLHIHKELAVQEDIVWGWGEVTQTRDLISGGTGPQQYHKVNAMLIPAKDELGAETSDVQTELDLRMTIAAANKKFALIGGSPTQTFHVAPATAGTHATPQSQVTAQIAAAVSGIANNYAKRNNVLGLDQTTPFTPTKNYQPATKLYVDNKLVQIGAGDMSKAVYDKNDNGIVDNSEALGGIASTDAFMYRGSGTTLDANNFADMGNWVGQNIANAPDKSDTMVANFKSTTGGLAIQMAYSQGTNRSAERVYDGTTWTPWSYALGHTDIVNNFAGNGANPYAVASANTVKQLHTAIQGVEGVPIGTIVMFSGNVGTLPKDWHLCNGAPGSGTPNLNDKFIKGTSDPAKIGTHGGTKKATMPHHTHTANHGHSTRTTSSNGDHHHSMHHGHSATISHASGSHGHEGIYWDPAVGANYGIGLMDFKPYGSGSSHHTSTGLCLIPGHGDKHIKIYGDASGHGHSISVKSFSGNTGSKGDHTHTVSIPTASVTTGAAQVAGDNEPPYYVLAYIMKIA